MNGAAAVPDRKIRMPTRNRKSTIGNSHHFLLWARKDRNSASKPWLSASAAASSKPLFGVMLTVRSGGLELAEVIPHIGRNDLGLPVGVEVGAPHPMQGVAADQPENERH